MIHRQVEGGYCSIGRGSFFSAPDQGRAFRGWLVSSSIQTQTPLHGRYPGTIRRSLPSGSQVLAFIMPVTSLVLPLIQAAMRACGVSGGRGGMFEPHISDPRSDKRKRQFPPVPPSHFETSKALSAPPCHVCRASSASRERAAVPTSPPSPSSSTPSTCYDRWPAVIHRRANLLEVLVRLGVRDGTCLRHPCPPMSG